jgi:hypothetical protein
MSAPPAAAEKQPPGAVAAVQRCTAAMDAYAARLDARTEQRRRRLKHGADDDEAPEAPGSGPPREPGFARGEGPLMRYAMVPVVIVLVGWVYGGACAALLTPLRR